MLSDGENSNYLDASDEEILVNAEKLMRNNATFQSLNFLDKLSEGVNSPSNGAKHSGKRKMRSLKSCNFDAKQKSDSTRSNRKSSISIGEKLPSTDALDMQTVIVHNGNVEIQNFRAQDLKMELKRPTKENAFSLKIQSLEIQDDSTNQTEDLQKRGKNMQLPNSVSLELELEPDFMPQTNFPEEPQSPTKGAPKFFKNMT